MADMCTEENLIHPLRIQTRERMRQSNEGIKIAAFSRIFPKGMQARSCTFVQAGPRADFGRSGRENAPLLDLSIRLY
jgi:hypothetical protein